jgi:hypothetical protein
MKKCNRRVINNGVIGLIGVPNLSFGKLVGTSDHCNNPINSCRIAGVDIAGAYSQRSREIVLGVSALHREAFERRRYHR